MLLLPAQPLQADILQQAGKLRAHFKTWCDRCGVSVKRTKFYVGFLHFGSTLVSLRDPKWGFEMHS